MTALLDYALTTVADVKESLDIDSGDSSKNNLITRKINQATNIIENYCSRRFKLTTYTDEEYNGTNVNQILLRNGPIVADSVTLKRRNSSLNEGDWETIDTEFEFVDENAGILGLSFNAIGGFERYRISYEAGYSTIPYDIQESAATLAAYLVSSGYTTGTNVKRKVEGQRSVEYFENTGGSIVEQLGLDDVLAPYVNSFLGVV